MTDTSTEKDVYPRQAWLAEFLGTFLLVFAGTGAIVVNHASAGAVTHVGISLAFGLAALIGICAFGSLSGAHFNPAVTVGLVLAGRFPLKQAPSFIATQCLAAVLASVALRACFPLDLTLGATLPAFGVAAAFAFEVLLTFFLMFVILHTTRPGNAAAALAPLAIGGTVALDALFGGPVSGASMNPARSFGPALVSGSWTAHWLYWLAPLLGAALAAATEVFFPKTLPSRS